MRMFGVDAVASGGGSDGADAVGARSFRIAKDDLVMGDKSPALKLTRSQETELPQQVEIGFTDSENRLSPCHRCLTPLVGIEPPGSARRFAAHHAAGRGAAPCGCVAAGFVGGAGRRRIRVVSHRRIDLEPGDMVSLPTDAGEKLHRIVRIADGPTRKITSRAIEPTRFREHRDRPSSRPAKRPPPVAGKPLVVVLDLPASLAIRHPSNILRWRRSVAERRHDLAFRRTARATRRIAFRSAGHYRPDDERARGRVPFGRSIRKRSSIRDFIRHHQRPSTTRRLSPAATCSPLRASDGRWEIRLRRPGRARWRARCTYIACRACCAALSGSEPEAASTVPAEPSRRAPRRGHRRRLRSRSPRSRPTPWRYRVGPALLDHGDPGLRRIHRDGRPRRHVRSALCSSRPRVCRITSSISWLRARSRVDGDAWEPHGHSARRNDERYELDIMERRQPFCERSRQMLRRSSIRTLLNWRISVRNSAICGCAWCR